MDHSLSLAFSVLSKQHLLLEHSCPQFCCLSSSDSAFDHPEVPKWEHSFCVQPPLPENPAEIPTQTTGYHVHDLGVGWRLPWPGTWFLSLLSLFNPGLELCGSMLSVEGSNTGLLQHLERKCHQE